MEEFVLQNLAVLKQQALAQQNEEALCLSQVS